MRAPALAALVLTPVLGVVALSSSGRAQQFEEYDARDLEIERFVGLLEVETGGVEKISAVWEPGEGLLDAPRFEVGGSKLSITQLGRRDDVDCRGGDEDVEVRVEGRGRHPIADYGRLRVRIPEGAHVEIGGGAVVGTVGDVGELSLGLSSCGTIAVGDVAGDAELAVNGSGDLDIGSVGGRLSIAVNGAGDIVVGPAAESLEAAINGSGDIEIASIAGDIEAAINGSGDIHVLGGSARRVEAAIMGSGELRFDGKAENVELAAFGSGDVYVAEVSGDVTTSAFGSGRVHVGQEN
jgi:hypothetical protein